VDNKLHVVDGYATIIRSDLAERPSVTFDLVELQISFFTFFEKKFVP
jgi:hypothetical protein